MTQYSERDIELVSAYLDGQVDDNERQEVEARLATDQSLRQLFAELKSLRRILGSLPAMSPPEHLGSEIIRRIAETKSREARALVPPSGGTWPSSERVSAEGPVAWRVGAEVWQALRRPLSNPRTWVWPLAAVAVALLLAFWPLQPEVLKRTRREPIVFRSERSSPFAEIPADEVQPGRPAESQSGFVTDQEPPILQDGPAGDLLTGRIPPESLPEGEKKSAVGRPKSEPSAWGFDLTGPTGVQTNVGGNQGQREGEVDRLVPPPTAGLPIELRDRWRRSRKVAAVDESALRDAVHHEPHLLVICFSGTKEQIESIARTIRSLVKQHSLEEDISPNVPALTSEWGQEVGALSVPVPQAGQGLLELPAEFAAAKLAHEASAEVEAASRTQEGAGAQAHPFSEACGPDGQIQRTISLVGNLSAIVPFLEGLAASAREAAIETLVIPPDVEIPESVRRQLLAARKGGDLEKAWEVARQENFSPLSAQGAAAPESQSLVGALSRRAAGIQPGGAGVSRPAPKLDAQRAQRRAGPLGTETVELRENAVTEREATFTERQGETSESLPEKFYRLVVHLRVAW